MAKYETSNPAFGDGVLREAAGDRVHGLTATAKGAATKGLILLGILIATASFTWTMVMDANAASSAAATTGGRGNNYVHFNPDTAKYMIGGLIGGLIFFLVTSFAPRLSPYTAPLYAACEGLFIGGISAIFETRYQGIAFEAGALTMATLGVMLFCYRTGLIQVTERFMAGVVAATGGIALVYLVSILMNLFGMRVPYIHDNGIVGIGFSLFVVTIAALNLVLDFHFAVVIEEAQMPKYMEWYAGFGLLTTLVWLYIEMLKLLAKLRSSNE